MRPPANSSNVLAKGTTNEQFATNLGALLLAVDAPVELLVTNPLGRQTGRNPSTQVEINEIPEAYYYSESIDDDFLDDGIDDSLPASNVFDNFAAVDGECSVQIFSPAARPFKLQIIAYRANGEPEVRFVNGNISAGASVNLKIRYSASASNPIQAITLNETGYVFLANDFVKIERNKNSMGNIHSNGKIEFTRGNPSTHTGNLTALDDIVIRTKNTIVGNVTTGDAIHLSGDVTVNGTKTEHATLSPIALPSLSFSAGGRDKTVNKNGSLVLPPGSYGRVEVKEKGKLLLSAGDYFINILDTDPSSVISIDGSKGLVNINVVKDLRFDTKVQIVVTGDGASTDKVTFATLQDEEVDIGSGALIQGNLIAPNAEVHFSKNSRFRGSVSADAITVDPNMIFLYHTSPGTFPKISELENEEGTEDSTSPVTNYELAQNYPNPFNPSTTIKFAMPEAGHVKLLIYDINGNLVNALVSGVMPAGRHSLIWDGTSAKGNRVASGVYIYRFEVNGFVAHKKMILTK